MNRELIFLRAFAVAAVLGMVLIITSAFKQSGNQKFSEIDVERINIIEKDGTVKMVITNVNRFPNANDKINGKLTNETRKKRSGMLFFNEDGIECGGFIYDGQKNEKARIDFEIKRPSEAMILYLIFILRSASSKERDWALVR